ncbi:MAG: TerC family protein [Crocinitomicaceae bacterium]|nr:TerC family protein [Crocinitomicaceae bacterium]
MLEIVLGIDNILFISIVTDELPDKQKKQTRNIGLIIALLLRLILLTIVSWLIGLTEPLFYLFSKAFSAQSLVLFFGGVFLIYKSVTELHKSVSTEDKKRDKKSKNTLLIIFQIIIIDLVFSFDSIISAIGMTNGMEEELNGGNPIIIIYLSIIISMVVMIIFASKISEFITKYPTFKLIALGFLVTIGILLVADAFGHHIPKGYLYFALVFSFIIELFNIRIRNLKS